LQNYNKTLKNRVLSVITYCQNALPWLKLDIGVYENDKLISILDTKWKLIDENQKYDNGNFDNKKGIIQSDIYQLFAYGKKTQCQKSSINLPKVAKI
jgi:5-methylcytosine-specific restriction enzyme subunit McrC